MSTRPYHNPTRQSVRRATVQNDRRVREASTYFQFATSEADPVHDRYEEISRSSVTGATQQYPKQPETSLVVRSCWP
jgi:hypothetical protein